MSVWGAQSLVSPIGDINNDEIEDLAVAVTLREQYFSSATQYDAQGVYILFGRGTWDGPIDVVADADVVIKGFSGALCVAGAGDFNDDGIDDLLIGADQADDLDGEGDGFSHVRVGPVYRLAQA